MSGKCEHGLTTQECFVCASPKYGERAELAQRGEPVAWRCFDGEGDYEYKTDEPDEATRAWSRRYGREWEPLYTAPPQRRIKVEKIPPRRLPDDDAQAD